MKRNVRNIKKLKELQNDDAAIVIYQDEVHFQVTTSVTRKWVIKGSEPKVKSAPGRKSVPYSGYVIPETGELIVTKPSWFNYETVIDSFRQLLKSYPVADFLLFPYPPQWDCLNMCLFHFETAPAILLLTDISIMLFDKMHSF